MNINNEINRKSLAAEAIDQLDLETMVGILTDQYEKYYEMLSGGDFNREWKDIFGEN